MSRCLTGMDLTQWERSYLQKFEAVRASLRGMQIDSDKLDLSKNKAAIKRMKTYFTAVDAAFDQLTAGRPPKRKKKDAFDDPELQAELSELSAEDLEGYGTK